MPRRLRTPKLRRRQAALSPLERYILETGFLPPASEREQYPGNPTEAFRMSHPGDPDSRCPRFERFKALYEAHRDDVLEQFTAKHPGERPYAWWLIDATAEQRAHREL